MRVHELATELGVKSKDILLLLEDLGVGGKTASSRVPLEHLSHIRSKLGGKAAPAEKPAAPKPDPARKTARAKPKTGTVSEVPETGEAEGGVVIIKLPISVAAFATLLDTDVDNIVEAAAGMGEQIGADSSVSGELALLIGELWGYGIEVREPEPPPAEPEPEPEPAIEAAVEPEPEQAPAAPPPAEEEPPAPEPLRVVPRRTAPPDAPGRPAVVTVMGHVDHGKTTLLDAIRETNVVAQEAGAITQHIGAYQVETKDRLITFIDTPGHEAFTAMRARGAQVTDVAVLVVGADDGVMPQTLEAVDHARAAGVPIIVAVNKVDRPSADIERVKQQLSERDLVPEEWGGETVFVPVSALEKTGIDSLLDMILLVADMADLRALKDKPAEGAVLEAELDRRRGPVATLLVQEGTLRTGDSIVVGPFSGKVRAMMDHRGKRVKEAPPATPVQVMGLSGVPEASELFRVVETGKEARSAAEEHRLDARREDTRVRGPRTMQEISQLLASGEAKVFRLVLKADAQGSVEAISSALSQISTQEVQLEILHAGVGDITESDVSLAAASKPSVLLGFQVNADIQARRLGADEHVEIRRYDVIYDLLDDVRNTLIGMLEVRYEEVVTGTAEVRALFRSSRHGTIAGCSVLEGRINRSAQIRVLRKKNVVYEGKLDSLRHLKEDVSEMAQGFECGIVIQSFNDFEVGDLVESIEQRQLRRTLL